jgi:pyrroline-5-carboxylate reductase
MPKKNIFFLGCGKMGGALIDGLIKNGVDSSSFLVLKPSDDNQIPQIKYVHSYSEIPSSYQADIVFFVFKPQMAKEILGNFAEQRIFNSKTIFISVLAGKEISFFENILGKEIKFIRLMPNLPITVGEGIFAYFCNSNIKKNEAFSILTSLGNNVELEKEELMNAITAISGSGPAYLFLFTQMLINAAKKLGIDEEMAKKIVKQTIFGSAKMTLDTDEDLEQLIKNVASKGGTTEAALEILTKDNDMQQIINKATKSACDRAKILSEIM